MGHYTYIHIIDLLWILNYLITTSKCGGEAQHARDVAPIRYAWHHFDSTEASQWSTTYSTISNASNTTDTLSCAMAMPSLCIYRVATEPMPAFHIFYNSEMYPFLLDGHWTSVAASNNLDTDALFTLSRKRKTPPSRTNTNTAAPSSSSSPSSISGGVGGRGGRRRLLQYNSYDGFGRGRRYRHRHCHGSIRCRLGRALGKMSRHIRLESRIRHKMYKVGVKVGQAMRKKNPWKLFQACLMTRICIPRRRRVPQPQTYVSFLGRPRVVSTSHYVTSYSPMSYAPGMMAAGAPQLVGHPANTLLGRHQYFRRRRMVAARTDGTSRVAMPMLQLYDDVRLKKCVESATQPMVEICATVYYYDAARLTLDVYKKIIDDDEDGDEALHVAESNNSNTEVRYDQLHVWQRDGTSGETEQAWQCNDELLSWIGARVCLQPDEENDDVLVLVTNESDATPMYKWSLLQNRQSTEWSKIYRVYDADMSKREKICKSMEESIDICFEMTFEETHIDQVEVSTQRIVFSS